MTHKLNAVFLAGGLAALLFAPPAFAQGCALCYNTAASQSPEAAKQLNYAILTLLVPTLSLFCGILIFAFRRRNAEMELEREEETSFALPGDLSAVPQSRATQPSPSPPRTLLPHGLS
jgi:hypothetical protein